MQEHSSPQDPQEWIWTNEEPPLRERIWDAIKYYGPSSLFVVILIASGAALVILEWDNVNTEDQILAELGRLYLERENVERGTQTSVKHTLAPTTLSVSSYPEGAKVYLNSEFVGVTPLENHALEAGVHIVSLREYLYEPIDTVIAIGKPRSADLFLLLRRAPESERSGWEHDPTVPSSGEIPDAVQVIFRPTETPSTEHYRPNRNGKRPSPSEEPPGHSAGGRTSSEMVEGNGKLWITSRPTGASVLVDGRETGQTPLILRGVPAGEHRVELYAEGYTSHVAEVNLRPYRNSSIFVQLSRMDPSNSPQRADHAEEGVDQRRKTRRPGW